MNQDEIARALQEFVGAFEVVFRDDWEYTKIMIGDEADGANFLEPELDDEFEDWGARGALLAKYRSLLAAMETQFARANIPVPNRSRATNARVRSQAFKCLLRGGSGLSRQSVTFLARRPAMLRRPAESCEKQTFAG